MDLKAQTYTTWPKNTRPKFILLGPNIRPKLFKTILNNLYKLEDFSLIVYFLQRDFFMFVFGLEQLIKSPNRMRWAQSSGKLLVLPIALCLLYSLINVVGAYSIITSLNILVPLIHSITTRHYFHVHDFLLPCCTPFRSAHALY